MADRISIRFYPDNNSHNRKKKKFSVILLVAIIVLLLSGIFFFINTSNARSGQNKNKQHTTHLSSTESVLLIL